MRAVAYCRYSSDNQRQESIEAQIRAIESYVKQNNLTLVDIYADEAKSATSDQRPQFQKMIKDAESGAFEVVLVHKLDRFARDRYDSMHYRRILKHHNIALISITENLDGSPESVILESLLEGMSEYYSRNLSRESMKGLMENAHKCKTTGGAPAFGYDVDPVTKQFVLNEKEAYCVKKMFEDYASGKSYTEIIDWISANGFTTRKGAPIKKNTLHGMLKNEKYMGIYKFNTSSRSKYASSNQSEVRIEGGVPAIVSRETFEIVQRKLDINKKNSQVFKAKTLYILSGKVVCGQCASKMFGNRRLSKSGNDWSGYLCSGRKKHICNAKEVKKSDLEEIVLNHLEKHIFTDEYLNALSDEILSAANEKHLATHAEIKLLKAKLTKLDTQISNLINAISEGFASDIVKSKLESMAIDRANTIAQIEIQEAKAAHMFTKEDIKKYLSQGKGIKFKSEMDQMHIIDMFLDKVVVYEDHIDIHFYIDNLKKKRGYVGAPYPYSFVSTLIYKITLDSKF